MNFLQNSFGGVYYLTVLVYIKTTIHLSVGGQWQIFTSPLCGLVNMHHSPLLFLCSNLFDFHLFADDSNLFFAESSLDSLVSKVNNLELKSIHSWLSCNKLSLNIDKTNFVIFHPNYGKFNICFKGAVLWNNIEASLKILCFDKFKCFLKKYYVINY